MDAHSQNSNPAKSKQGCACANRSPCFALVSYRQDSRNFAWAIVLMIMFMEIRINMVTFTSSLLLLFRNNSPWCSCHADSLSHVWVFEHSQKIHKRTSENEVTPSWHFILPLKQQKNPRMDSTSKPERVLMRDEGSFLSILAKYCSQKLYRIQ